MKITDHNHEYFGTPLELVNELRLKDHGRPANADVFIKRLAKEFRFEVEGATVEERCESFLQKTFMANIFAPVFEREHVDEYAIRILRKWHGYSREKLAQQLGVTQMTINRWENEGQVPSAEHLDAIKRVLFDQRTYVVPKRHGDVLKTARDSGRDPYKVKL